MNLSVVIATCGGQEWSDLAWSRAYPSVRNQYDIAGLAPQVVVEHYPELSVPEARNAAARHATEDWLCFLDADDELAPGYVEAIDLARGPEEMSRPTLYVPDVQYVSAVEEAEPRCLRDDRVPLYVTNWAVIGTVLPRALFDEVGGFEDEPIYEDWILWMRCYYDFDARMVPVSKAVYRAWVNEDGEGRNMGVDAAGVYTRWRSRYENVTAT